MTGGGRSIRVLALATNPAQAPSTRFRVLQWEPALRRAGFELTLDAFYSAQATADLYRPGRYATKLAHFVGGLVQRGRVLQRAAGAADLLLIHREACPLGWPLGLQRVREFPGAVVYDYDDAMFLHQRKGRGLLHRLERVDTPGRLMAASDAVLAGNSFLGEYARGHAGNVVVLPTCIDTERFRPAEGVRADGTCVVGWIGSHSTAKYLVSLVPVLEAVAREHPFRLAVVGSPAPLRVEGVAVDHAPWSLEREVADFQRCDIGVSPLWDDAWSRGKCGFKAIEFMACGIPVVAAAVGANFDIIEDGVNGFLAATPGEWREKLGWLLADAPLRRKLGRAGRETILARYSLDAHAPTIIGALRSAIGRAASRRGR